MAEKRFLIHVERPWTLLILPVLALLYFLAILLLVLLGYEITGIPTEYLVLGGAALFGLTLLIQIPYIIQRRERQETPAPETLEPEAAEPQHDAFTPQQAEPTYAAPPAPRNDELLRTQETAKGLQVLEYSAPAKSRTPGAVYAKTMVPVTKEHVLRIETLAAEPHEI